LKRTPKVISEIKKLQELSEETSTDIKEKIDKRFAAEKITAQLREEQKNLFSAKEGIGRELEKTEGQRASLMSGKENIIARMWDEYELTLTDAQNNYKIPENSETATRRATELKNAMRALGEINLGAIEEYGAVKQRYENLTTQVNDLVKAKTALEKIIEELLKQMEDIFADKFKIINETFGNVFKELFNGGTAKLQLEDPDNILESGIEIYVAPPGKIIKHLSSLSGGEQTLTAIALYFAILKIKPAPFCLLDEIEAALDDVNVIRFAEYLRNLSENTQFIVITHRRGTMEAADRLCGVTMKEKGISRIITININEIEQNI
jgi:chromosome segregation protein